MEEESTWPMVIGSVILRTNYFRLSFPFGGVAPVELLAHQHIA
jgi:hypothetical protein